MRHLPVIQEQTLAAARVQREQVAQEWQQQALRGTQDNRVACHTGCDHCCYHPVYVTFTEAFDLYQAIRRTHYWSPAVRSRLEEASNLTLGLNPTMWMLAKIPCPFLDNSRCGVYDNRPFNCRITLATQDPYYCHPHRIAEGLTSIVDRSWAQEQRNSREAPLAKQLGLPTNPVPLATGILLVDAWHQGTKSLEDLGWDLRMMLK